MARRRNFDSKGQLRHIYAFQSQIEGTYVLSKPDYHKHLSVDSTQIIHPWLIELIHNSISKVQTDAKDQNASTNYHQQFTQKNDVKMI